MPFLKKVSLFAPNLNNKHMRHSISIFLALTIMVAPTFTSLAEEKKIEVNKSQWHEEIRSTSCVPTITHDSNTLCIYSNIILENLHIIVKDRMGTTLYSNTVTISSNQHYSFTINNIKEGDFLIELTHENKYLYGYFYISQ